MSHAGHAVPRRSSFIILRSLLLLVAWTGRLRSSFIILRSLLLLAACLPQLGAGEPDTKVPNAPAQDLQELLVGHWREKGEKAAKLGEDQTDYFFGPDKCVIHTKGVQGESFAFYDYAIWQAWPARRMLILSMRDDADAVKWIVDFGGSDRKQITFRERTRKTLAKPTTLIRVDDRTEPDK